MSSDSRTSICFQVSLQTISSAVESYLRNPFCIRRSSENCLASSPSFPFFFTPLLLLYIRFNRLLSLEFSLPSPFTSHYAASIACGFLGPLELTSPPAPTSLSTPASSGGRPTPTAKMHIREMLADAERTGEPSFSFEYFPEDGPGCAEPLRPNRAHVSLWPQVHRHYLGRWRPHRRAHHRDGRPGPDLPRARDLHASDVHGHGRGEGQ